MKIYAIEINNLSHGQFCGQAVPHGTLCAQVDRIPEQIFTRHGNYFISTTEGVVSYYHYRPGSKGGFANRPITLKVAGQGKVFPKLGITEMTFSGTLWDQGHREVQEILGYPLYRIGLRTGIHNCYCSFNVTEEWINKIGQIVKIDDPQQRLKEELEIK